MSKCIHCDREYINKQGQETYHCSLCTFLILKIQEDTLDAVKYALNSNTYWDEIKKINTRRKQLM